MAFAEQAFEVLLRHMRVACGDVDDQLGGRWRSGNFAAACAIAVQLLGEGFAHQAFDDASVQRHHEGNSSASPATTSRTLACCIKVRCSGLTPWSMTSVSIAA